MALANTTRNVYFKIIQEVISNMKDELELAGADTGFLEELKRTWEAKLQESGAVGPAEDPSRAQPAFAPTNASQPSYLAPSATKLNYGPTQGPTAPVLQYPATGTMLPGGVTAAPPVANTMKLNGTPQFSAPSGGSYNGLSIQGGRVPQQQQQSTPLQLQQLSQYSTTPAAASSSPSQAPSYIKKEKDKPTARNLDDEELNSGDELSDGDAEQEIDNYCVCMFEKMSRTKSKRKATLIHGVTHIHGRDYIFSKANAEFDWS